MSCTYKHIDPKAEPCCPRAGSCCISGLRRACPSLQTTAFRTVPRASTPLPGTPPPGCYQQNPRVPDGPVLLSDLWYGGGGGRILLHFLSASDVSKAILAGSPKSSEVWVGRSSGFYSPSSLSSRTQNGVCGNLGLGPMLLTLEYLSHCSPPAVRSVPELGSST